MEYIIAGLIFAGFVALIVKRRKDRKAAKAGRPGSGRPGSGRPTQPRRSKKLK